MDVLAFAKTRGNFPSLMMGCGSVLAGTAAAAIHGNMDILAATVCLLFALVTQLGANYFHSWCIMMRRGYSEPRPRIDDGEFRYDPLSMRIVREATTACLIVSLMLGFTLMTMSTSTLWAICWGLMIYGIQLLLNYGKHPLYGTIWAVVATFLCFGPIGVIGTTIIQTQHEATALGVWDYYDLAPAIFLSIGMGFLACNVHLLYSYHNYKIDPKKNPTSVTAKMGRGLTVFVVFLNGLLLFLLVTFFLFDLNFPEPLLACAPVFIGFAFNTYIAVRMPKANIGEIAHLGSLTKVNFVLTSVTLLIVWIAIGLPDDSYKVLFDPRRHLSR